MIGLIMAGNSEAYLETCIKAIESQVDKLIICYDTSSKDKTYDIIIGAKTILKDKLEIIEREYEHDFNIKNANSNQRNFYLNYIKEKYDGEWCCCIDGDEIVDTKLVEFDSHRVELENENILLCNPKMEHFIGDLSHVDFTNESHFVFHRLFKIHKELVYPNGEHPVLQSTREGVKSVNIDLFIIYHLGYIPSLNYFKNRYENHLAKSEIHTSDFLQDWYYAHITGQYPKKPFDITKLPKILKEHFLIDDDYFYFKNRNLEIKHIIDAAQWRDYFKPSNVLLVGDGKGIRTTACILAGLNAKGYDISAYAVNHTISNLKSEVYWQQSLLDTPKDYSDEYDLVVCYDVLEHIDEKDIDIALDNLKIKTSNHLLISVPMIGDPNLTNDPTHKIFWTREQWEDKIMSAGFDIVTPPSHFLFTNQLILAKVKK